MFENHKITEAYANMNSPSAVMENRSPFGLVELNEASLNRVLKNGEDLGYCIISACRHDWPEIELEKIGGKDSVTWQNMSSHLKNLFENPKYWNNMKTVELVKILKNSNFGYIPVYGGYMEGDKHVYERSYMLFPINNKGEKCPFKSLEDEVIKLGGKDYFHQESVLIKPPHEAPYYYVTTKHKDTPWEVGTILPWFDKNVKLNDVAQQYFTSLNKIGKHVADGETATVKRFTYNNVDESTCDFIGFYEKAGSHRDSHVRWLSGQLNYNFI
jgi:hypothetical protein